MKSHLYTLTFALALTGATAHSNDRHTHRVNALTAPFITAVKAGDLQLFDAYAKIRKITNFERITDAQHGMNPLHWAAALGHVDMIRYLIMHGANVNATTPRGLTALHIATFANQKEAVKCLVLEGKCIINQPMPSGLTAFELAKRQKNAYLEAFLAKYQRSRTARFAVKLPRNIANIG